MPSVVPGRYYREMMAPVRRRTYVRSLGCWVCSKGAMRKSLCVSSWFVTTIAIHHQLVACCRLEIANYEQNEVFFSL